MGSAERYTRLGGIGKGKVWGEGHLGAEHRGDVGSLVFVAETGVEVREASAVPELRGFAARQSVVRDLSQKTFLLRCSFVIVTTP